MAAPQKKTEFTVRTRTAPAARGRAQEEREPAQFWLNVGMTVPNPETGEDMFVQIGGIAFDDIKIPNGASMLNSTKRALIENILAEFEEMAAGDEIEAADFLELKMRRASDPNEQPVTETAAAIHDLFAARRKS